MDVDEEIHDDIQAIISKSESIVRQKYPEGSFQQVFWDQQLAASSTPGKGRRWHPLMIKWCIFLHHQSSAAYETLRQSGVIHLPSQRTLRDYTNCVKATVGFSSETDEQLMKAAHFGSCPVWQKLVFLLLDEMYIREDLVYNKHSGKLVGFVNLGDLNNHLLEFERSLQGERESDTPVLAKTMMSFMVKGVFTALRYPYAHFPSERLTRELLFQPFWEAVYHFERMGFKVTEANKVNII